jgi:serine/threonine protein kinase
MAIAATPAESSVGKFAGMAVPLSGVGRVELTQLLHKNSETAIYASTRPGMVVKTFDLDCGKPDEVSYGPYVGYKVEVENWQDVHLIDELRSRIPAFYGSDIDYQKKVAFIAMEYLEGCDFLSWCQNGADQAYAGTWADDFRASLYETLDIVRLFHKHGILLIDFKPDNVIRLSNGAMKFVDMGAFFTPRHSKEAENYVYSATPDYAELVIDTSMIQTGLPIKQGADIFAAGVAMFEMAMGTSRLGMADDCAEQMLQMPEIYLFRDSQIRDIWKAYPHLKDLLPLIQTQLRERRILFSEFWHLLKGYLAKLVPEWEGYDDDQRRELLISTGSEFISDQLPDQLKWLAKPIAHATTLRSYRIQSIGELLDLLAAPISEEIRADIAAHNPVVQMARDLEPPVEFREAFNQWEVRLDPRSGHYAISSRRLATHELRQISLFTFLKEACRDEAGHRFYEIVGDLEADMIEGERMTLDRLAQIPGAWL